MMHVAKIFIFSFLIGCVGVKTSGDTDIEGLLKTKKTLLEKAYSREEIEELKKSQESGHQPWRLNPLNVAYFSLKRYVPNLNQKELKLFEDKKRHLYAVGFANSYFVVLGKYSLTNGHDFYLETKVLGPAHSPSNL